MTSTSLTLAEQAGRENLGAFVARAVRLEASAVVRLRRRPGPADVVEAWTATPFDVLATRSVHGSLTTPDITVAGSELLAALAVARDSVVDPGPSRDLLWRSELPGFDGWMHVDDLPLDVVTDVTDRGLDVARENAGPKGTPPASLLDQPVLTVSGGSFDIKIPMRVLFALSGMGFTGGSGSGSGRAEEAGSPSGAQDVVRVSATESWLRLDARFGAVVRRRHAMLPLIF